MHSNRGGLVAVLSLLTAVAPLGAQTYRAAGDDDSRTALAAFGAALAVGDDFVLVGERDVRIGPGLVYVYREVDGEWTETDRFTASDGQREDDFGASLALDGDRLLVGAPGAADGAGVVYVFQREGASWREVGRLDAPAAAEGSDFGTTLALAGDVAFVGAPDANDGAGAVHVYSNAGGEWTHASTLTAPQPASDQGFGSAVALRGDVALIGAPGANQSAGIVHVYRGAGGSWSAEGTLQPNGLRPEDGFGMALALGDGLALVGAPFTDESRGSVYRYHTADDGSWLQNGVLLPFAGDRRDRFGWALEIDGDAAFVGAPGARDGRGVAYHFWRTDEEWSGSAAIGSVDAEARANLGSNLAVDDDLAAASMLGADFGSGTVAIYERAADGTWQQRTVVLGDAETFAAVTGGVECGVDGQAAAFNCSGVDLQAFMPVSSIGGGRGVRLNDIWGWTDPQTGREYALVGRIDGTSFVDITDARNPTYLGSLPRTEGTPPSVWRDIKVYENHAFIVADGADDHGVQIFDLTRLRDIPASELPVTFDEDAHYDQIASAHNIVIDTATGFAYSVGNSSGGRTCGGGLHIINVQEPLNPTFAGCFADPLTGRAGTGYTHDAQCTVYHGPDDQYAGREICFNANETAISIADVTDKQNTVAISRAAYPNVGYTHQGWLNEDQTYYFLGDELDELAGSADRTRTLVWDVRDLDDPQLVLEFMGETGATDHNLYIRDGLMYQSNYVSGLRIIDVGDPLNPHEVAFFDTVPYGENQPGFGGSWSNYPFFPSGNIILTSGYEGLFIVRKSDRQPISQ